MATTIEVVSTSQFELFCVVIGTRHIASDRLGNGACDGPELVMKRAGLVLIARLKALNCDDRYDVILVAARLGASPRAA